MAPPPAPPCIRAVAASTTATVLRRRTDTIGTAAIRERAPPPRRHSRHNRHRRRHRADPRNTCPNPAPSHPDNRYRRLDPSARLDGGVAAHGYLLDSGGAQVQPAVGGHQQGADRLRKGRAQHGSTLHGQVHGAGRGPKVVFVPACPPLSTTRGPRLGYWPWCRWSPRRPRHSRHRRKRKPPRRSH